MRIYKRDITFLLIGAAGGAVGMFFITKNAIEQELDAEVEELRKYYKEMEDDIKEDVEVERQEKKRPDFEVVPDIKEPESFEEVEEYKDIIRNTENSRERVAYEKILKDIGYNEDPNKPRDIQTPPFVISEPEMMREYEEYSKITLTYFLHDEVLMSEDESLIDDIEDLVGLDNLNDFGKYGEDPEVMYVRNHKLMSDFEILRIDGSYEDIMMGMNEIPEEEEDE